MHTAWWTSRLRRGKVAEFSSLICPMNGPNRAEVYASYSLSACSLAERVSPKPRSIRWRFRAGRRVNGVSGFYQEHLAVDE